MQNNCAVRACMGKIPYKEKSEASEAKRRMLKKGRGKMEAYKCPYCKAWHIGHSMKQTAKAW
jgi:hypothetical protein